MLLLGFTAVAAVFIVTNALPTPNSKDGGPIGELPENWDQTKDDTQSLFLNKSDKNDLEPYPLALSEEGNSEGFDQGVEQRFDNPSSNGELDNLIMRPELYGEPPAMESLSTGYDSRRRKRGSGTKVGGAGAATKVATKSGGKKNLKPEEHNTSPIESVSHDHDTHRRKRGSGTKVGGAAASAKSATKNSGGNKRTSEASDSSSDIYISSNPESPKSKSNLSRSSDMCYDDEQMNEELIQAVNYLHTDNALLEAAELGDHERLEQLLNMEETNKHQMDHLGRTALHMAVCSGNERSIRMLLEAGICPTIKDNVGMTPLSLCLMRNPSPAIANLLFDYGAIILPRASPMDTGLFIQFVAMCTPTKEEEKLLELLVQKGAMINDPEAPGGRQALHIAALSNNCKLIAKLIELGADVNMRNARNETAKDFAFLFNCKKAYEFLSHFDDDDDDDNDSSRYHISSSSEASEYNADAEQSHKEDIGKSRRVTIGLDFPRYI